MLKQLMQTVVSDGSTVELFQTAHKKKPNYHVRYGLSVNSFESLRTALSAYQGCIDHALQCTGIMDDYDND